MCGFGFLHELSWGGLQIVKRKAPAPLCNCCIYLGHFCQTLLRCVYESCHAHLQSPAHISAPFFQPGINKAQLSAQRMAGNFFSHPLNGKFLINTKNINPFLMNKHRAIVLLLREVCVRWTKKTPWDFLAYYWELKQMRIRKHFVLPRRTGVGRIYW